MKQYQKNSQENTTNVGLNGSFANYLRRAIAPFVVVGATLPMYSKADDYPPNSVLQKLDKEEDIRNLKKTKEALKDASTGLDLLSQAAYIRAISSLSKETSQAFQTIKRLKNLVSDLDRSTGKVIELLEDEAEAEAKKVAKEISKQVKEETSNNDFDEYLKQLESEINDLDVGLVSEKSDPKFQVTLELITNDPEEAVARLKALAEAMSSNIKELERRQKLLDKVFDTATRTSKAFYIWSENLATAAEYGTVFANLLIFEFLDAEELGRQCGLVADAAEQKITEIVEVLEAEKERLKNLETNLKTFFGDS